MSVQILGLNDYHGQLEAVEPGRQLGRPDRLADRHRHRTRRPRRRVPARRPASPAGGTEYLATHVANLKATNPNTVFVSAGDLIGATPLLSALFHDEPSVEAFNIMGLDYNGVGNHEFDEGIDELHARRLRRPDRRRLRPGAARTAAIRSTAAATATRTTAPTSRSSPPTSPTRTAARRSSRRTPSTTSRAA